MQVYAKFGLLGAVSFTLCNMYCSFLHNDVCTMHVSSSYMHLHGPLVVPCDVCGGRGDGQGTAPSILVQHLECNQTSADQHFETKHTFDQVQHSTSSKCSMVNCWPNQRESKQTQETVNAPKPRSFPGQCDLCDH